MRSIRQSRAIAVAAAVALATAACSSGGDSSSGTNADGTVTLTWWHNGSSEPLLSFWQQVADEYHAAHPDVTINIQPQQNEDFQTKIPVALQSDDPPSLYQQWGGGDQASQVTSGKVKDLTQEVSGWIGQQIGTAAERWQTDGKQYGVPYDLHVVGFWYRTDLFAQAGVTAPPTTMDELTAAIAKLKAAGIVPIALGGKDRWPDAFYYDYFAVRECPQDVLTQQIQAQKLDHPCWTKAGQDLQSFLALEPFQPAFLGTPAQQGAGSSAGMLANGQAAMELQGDWQLPTMVPLTQDKDLNSKLGWFPFPAIPGGAGDPNAVLGGGDGFSCTTKTTAACADFLKYITSTEVQTRFAAAGNGLPSNPAAASAITDPTLKKVLAASQQASFTQTYFDRAFPTNIGQALNDAIANFFAGEGTLELIPASVSQAATGNR